MFTVLGSARVASPVREPVESAGVAGRLRVLVAGVIRLLVVLALFCWRAPLLVLGLVSLVGLVALVVAGSAWVALALILGLLAATVAAALAWPDLARWVWQLMYGQALRVGVYRPRWETACHAAGLVVRVGQMRHTPVLVRHCRRDGVDVLTVHASPGQTVADWAGACASLASAFSAHTVTATAGPRSGWVRLHVLRKDPLAGERTSTEPRKRTAGPVLLGRDETGHSVSIDPYGTAHVALQGATRSGKSATTYTFLGALAHREDVVVCGVDPSGILLSPFTSGPGRAYIATGTSADSMDHAAQVLADLVALMDARIDMLRSSGTDKLDLFTASLPAVWTVLEEYPGLIAAAKALDAERGSKPGQRLAARIERAVGRLVKEGAKVGLFTLVIAQRMSADALSTDDRANIATRITLRVDNSDAVRMLHEGISGIGADVVRDFAPGVALIESPGEPLRRVRFHYTDYATYRQRVTDGLAATPTPALSLPGTIIAHTSGPTSGQVVAA